MMRRSISLFLIAVLGIMVSACNADITRNDDRSLTIDVTLPAETIQTEIATVMSQSNLNDVQVESQEGFIAVSAERARPNGSQTDAISFRLQLAAVDGELVATISDLQINGRAANDDNLAELNAQIAEKLSRAGQNRPNSSLQAVAISDDAVIMTWRVERNN